MKHRHSYGLMTAGGDCPGLNAALRAVTRTLEGQGGQVLGIHDGFRGLVEGSAQALRHDDVKNVLAQGGSILGSSNRDNPFAYLDLSAKQPRFHDRSQQALMQAMEWGLRGLIVIGGDGSLAVAGRMAAKGLPCIVIPKTIDNDVAGSDLSIGFDTAVEVACQAMDRLHSTASSHHRVMVVEVMGRQAGWLALASGLASGADAILIPELRCDMKRVVEKVGERKCQGRAMSLIVVAEGAKPWGRSVVARKEIWSVEKKRLGGVGQIVADEIQGRCGVEARAVVLGHVVRGGTPTAFDRNLATGFGVEAAKLALAGHWNRALVWQAGQVQSVPLKRIAGKSRGVPLGHAWLRAARLTGVELGT